jgi:hypothetical protein
MSHLFAAAWFPLVLLAAAAAAAGHSATRVIVVADRFFETIKVSF